MSAFSPTADAYLERRDSMDAVEKGTNLPPATIVAGLIVGPDY